MTSIEINPRGIEEEYLRNLNLCFANWGDHKTFDWYFRRKTAFTDADLIVLRNRRQMIAGSAVTYRRVALANDHEITVGIITGVWTHPEFRRQGCFALIIKESLRLTREKAGTLLLGFVTRGNASGRQMARAGAALFPTSYHFSTPETACHNVNCQFAPVADYDKVGTFLYDLMKNDGKNFVRFVYPSEGDFRSQFIFRPGITEIVSDGQGNFAVIEISGDTERLQLLLTKISDEETISRTIGDLLARARERERKLFLFSVGSKIEHICQKLGFGHKAGYLTAVVANRSRLRRALKISESSALHDANQLTQHDDPWFLGYWNVQGGDRV